MKYYPKKLNSGFSLIEVLVSLAILGIGAMLSLKLIGVFINTNKSMSSNQEALALVNRLVAEVMDARYRSPTDLDPGLAASSTPIVAPITGSTIQAVGYFLPESYVPVSASSPFLPKFKMRYLVSDCTTCTTPDPANPGQIGPGGVDVLIEVDNFDPDNSALMRPIRMAIRRTYSHALACAGLPVNQACAVRGYN